MKNEILSSNTIIAQPLCPLHIGAGRKLGKFDFIYQDGSIIVLDENKLINWIASDESGRLAAEFEKLVVTQKYHLRTKSKL